MPLSVAIVGAGPAGFYTVEALLERHDDVRIDIVERLPTPFGLVRAGVAPDHQTTKKVARKFEQTVLRDRVHYYGNVAVGHDVTLGELRRMYDAVVLAVGAPMDRSLGIPGEHKRGVYGSAAFVGWYNGHPDFRDLNPDLDTERAVIVGNGNVALDVARVLVKSSAEMAISDIPDYAADAIRASPLTDVYILGRRGPLDAKFTNVELREMGCLESAVPWVDPGELPDCVGEIGVDDRERRLREKNLATLRAFALRRREEKPKAVRFVFHAAPVAILGGDKVEGVRFEKTRVENGRAIGTGEVEALACGLVVAAIGYRASPIPDVPYDPDRGLIRNDSGRVSDGLYAVGWAKRGPAGVIATNRPDGVACAEQIRADVPEGSKPGRPALERCLRERNVRAVTFDEWRAIDAAEVAQAVQPAPRRKFTTLSEMLSAIHRDIHERSALVKSTERRPPMSDKPYAGDLTPKQAWEILANDPRAVLVDVRTPAEWTYVGVPDLSPLGKKPVFLPWVLYPTIEVNAQFSDQMRGTGTDSEAPLLFLCRSGVRSRAAAIAMTSAGHKSCYNVATGFEGDLDAAKHRGTISGWKAEGLPWVQG